MSRLLDRIRKRVLLGDGAMGTQLQLAGLGPGECGEAWNLDHPERVLAIQRAYVEAGSDCLTTNTFGGCRVMLERHGEADRVVELNRAAVAIARRALGDRDGFVLGDVGPFGGILEPLGDVPRDAVERAFAEQIEALVAAGADAILIETQTALEELEIAVRAARAANAPAVIGSMAFDRMFESDDVRTMMGISPEQAAERMAELGVDVVALNCGTDVDMESAAAVVRRYRASCDLPVMAQPNAGRPVVENLRTVYKQPATEMAAQLPGLLAAGTRIVGACCGSTPEHIRRFREVLDGRQGVGA